MVSTPDVRFKSAFKHLDVFERGWKAEHHAAMALYDFQEFVAEALDLFESLNRRSKEFRQLVFGGVIAADAVAVQNEKAMFERWLLTAGECETTLAHFETEFGSVEGAEEFRKAVADVKTLLTGWHPPAKSLARSLRVRRLTETEVTARQQLVASGTP